MYKALAACVLLIAACAPPVSECTREVLTEIPSPDKLVKAMIAKQSCGTADEYSIEVSVVPVADALPDAEPNLFIAERQTQDARLQVRWKSPTDLVISYGEEAKIVKSEKHALGVYVTYALIP